MTLHHTPKTEPHTSATAAARDFIHFRFGRTLLSVQGYNKTCDGLRKHANTYTHAEAELIDGTQRKPDSASMRRRARKGKGSGALQRQKTWQLQSKPKKKKNKTKHMRGFPSA